MGPFGALLWISHYVALFLQLTAASQATGRGEVDNHISGNALFTEVPHDIITQSGQDVEMACSFRGAGSSSVSLEIQWWYLRQHRELTEKPSWTTNQVAPVEEMTRDATKISVVKVAGSNISHRLRLSSVKPTDEGTYECRVIDFSDNHAQHHRVRAYLQVQPQSDGVQLYKEDHHLQKERPREEQNEPDHYFQYGDHKLHQKEHHRGPQVEQANEGKNKHSSSVLHQGEHHRKVHQHPQEGNQHQERDHFKAQEMAHPQPHGKDTDRHQTEARERDYHQANKQTQANKNSLQSEVKGHKSHAAEISNDCSTDECLL
ncbi:V-set and transmembrane domain-containing protein 2-like protein [Hoplias malabaricus]|uniref:V-set and transmembrane domain-containing protein 2-like protein n=1 Tax=Hoplias malabaricus TaxID=27720 RepID=UPI003461F789